MDQKWGYYYNGLPMFRVIHSSKYKNNIVYYIVKSRRKKLIEMNSYAHMSHIIIVRRRIFFRSCIEVYIPFWGNYYYAANDNIINTNLNE